MSSESTLEAEFTDYKAMFRYEAKVFKELVDSVSKILDEGLFIITGEGLMLRGMDPARVALVDIEIPSSSFFDFSISGDVDRVELGVNMETLKGVVARAKKGDQLEVRVSEDKVLFIVESVVLRRYLLPNLEVVVDVPEEISLEFDATATVIADVVKKTLRDVELVGDIVEFDAGEDYLSIRSIGTERRRVETRLTRESPALIDLDVKAPATSRYDVSYLKRMLGVAKIAESIELSFSTDRPLMMVFRSPDGSRVTYLLAPSTG
ncbi:DNA polymerase sliding clamp A [Aeropyrum camini]|uniref:DNA polymerase sliding clamp n=1 Tax=Aeropyrum camini SY1 = JCM 12091 TaxID=1198449 RepID=U3T7V0_9CREN|nr:DNA polymerase sliding clamp A [Aeropyrum camini]BAN89597.1 DNA polymerase sliding clamp A [Aeropyrum camini SY1 = JCM 12091]